MMRRLSHPSLTPTWSADPTPFLEVTGVLRELGGHKHPYAMLLLEVDNVGIVARLDEPRRERLMHAAARRTRKAIGDCVVARLGARRLIVLLEGPIDEVAAISVTERLHQTLRAAFEIDHGGFFVTTSIGIGLGDWNSEPTEVLLLSERALERVRLNGGDATAVEATRSIYEDVRENAA